jgi:hypothetical protein
MITEEHKRLKEHHFRTANWKNWGPYLSERAWGSVREDYSKDGDAWNYFPFEHAKSRAYRWNEDGLGGVSDRRQHHCFSWALWNGKDEILKERIFGLTGSQGNHGEDVKDYYFYLDSTPTHSYMKMLYKYPHAKFPYEDLLAENKRRGRLDREYELLDTGVFADNRYWDVFFEYAKAEQNHLLIKATIVNRGPETADCHLLGQLWLRNTWSWGYKEGPLGEVKGKPSLKLTEKGVETSFGYVLTADNPDEWLFCENETNHELLYGKPNPSPYTKDGFHRHLVEGEKGAVNPDMEGTKVAAHFHVRLAPGESRTIRLRIAKTAQGFDDFDVVFAKRIEEADAFYKSIQKESCNADELMIQRQAFAGMLWSKQLYYYDVEQWLAGDPGLPPPPEERHEGRNHNWEHLTNFDVISMPDKWEYPWYASWDLAFHCVPLVLIDPDFAKRQLLLMTREWYMHPNGQIPAYEWTFGDANPPVHAWAALRIYKIDEKWCGRPDREFLAGIFHKLLMNFTWWVNRKDAEGRNVFQGGFLGLDNISVFDRSQPIAGGGFLDQSDGTAWMGFYCLGMMKIALELAKDDPIYQDSATKFFEHFLRIAHAMTSEGRRGRSLWDEDDGFFYDAVHFPDGTSSKLRVRSLVGLLPLLAVETIDAEILETMPVFKRRMEWFMSMRAHLAGNMASVEECGMAERHLLSIVTKERLISLCKYMLSETEFLSKYGIRSVSKYHENHPFHFKDASVNYEPAESETGLFGGNSNWRGPIWFPLNFLIIESLQKYHHFYGDELKVECPTGSGNFLNLWDVATELSQRLISLFLREDGRRPVHNERGPFVSDPHWQDLILFYEYFHGDDGSGLGANHQTGWTGLVAKLIQQSGGLL